MTFINNTIDMNRRNYNDAFTFAMDVEKIHICNISELLDRKSYENLLYKKYIQINASMDGFTLKLKLPEQEYQKFDPNRLRFTLRELDPDKNECVAVKKVTVSFIENSITPRCYASINVTVEEDEELSKSLRMHIQDDFCKDQITLFVDGINPSYIRSRPYNMVVEYLGNPKTIEVETSRIPKEGPVEFPHLIVSMERAITLYFEEYLCKYYKTSNTDMHTYFVEHDMAEVMLLRSIEQLNHVDLTDLNGRKIRVSHLYYVHENIDEFLATLLVCFEVPYAQSALLTITTEMKSALRKVINRRLYGNRIHSIFVPEKDQKRHFESVIDTIIHGKK